MHLTLDEVLALTAERAGLEKERERLIVIDRRILEIDDTITKALGLGPRHASLPRRSPPMAMQAAIDLGEPGGVSTGRRQTNGERLLAIIAEAKGAPLDYGAVAVALYGEESEENHARLRSALSSLSNGKKIRTGRARRSWIVE